MVFNIQPEELTKLVNVWEAHRNGTFPCTNRGDAKLEYRSGGGIGTRVFAVCGCGHEFDVTNYHSW